MFSGQNRAKLQNGCQECQGVRIFTEGLLIFRLDAFFAFGGALAAYFPQERQRPAVELVIHFQGQTNVLIQFFQIILALLGGLNPVFLGDGMLCLVNHVDGCFQFVIQIAAHFGAEII